MMMAASHSQGKIAVDKIFGANGQALQAINKYGKEKVVNCTQGVLLDENEVLVWLPTVEKTFHSLAPADVVGYAPIRGLPDFLESIIDYTFGEYKPNTFIEAVATSGGAGALHHSIWNYSEIGDTILTTDWFWSPYRVLCKEAMRELDVFTLFDAAGKFNMPSFTKKTAEILERQTHLQIILNTPAHNPTGYSLSDPDWDAVLECLKGFASDGSKRITLLIDAAYLDFTGDPSGRKFFKKFEKLPANLLIIVAVSMSKSFTMYGQRTGAMIGLSSDQDVIREFVNINEYTSRATWSNINRGAMKTLSTICRDKTLVDQVNSERVGYLRLIEKRAEVFINEAKQVGLTMLPYIAGFFLTIPSDQPDDVCNKLHEKNIFLVPLEKGVRLAVCAVPTRKISGVAAAIKQAVDEVAAN
jgi:aromatic-amino-acid transaminase